MRNLLLSLFLIIATLTQASVVDTLDVYSPSMEKTIAVSVVKPDKMQGASLAVVYLLHGYGDNNLFGYLSKTDVADYADKMNVIIVIPDGGKSLYFDSPVDKSSRYETFVAKELVAYVDKNYPTAANRQNRAVTGLSMGGHGALYLAIRHQNVFGAAGSMSGGVDFRPFPEKWNIKNVLGVKATHSANWNNNTVISQVPKLKPGSLGLIIDCGTEDFFYEVNCNLHAELTKYGIPHEFTTRPGNHSWTYWRRSLRDHFLFFNDYFKGETVQVPFE